MNEWDVRLRIYTKAILGRGHRAGIKPLAYRSHSAEMSGMPYVSKGTLNSVLKKAILWEVLPWKNTWQAKVGLALNWLQFLRYLMSHIWIGPPCTHFRTYYNSLSAAHLVYWSIHIGSIHEYIYVEYYIPTREYFTVEYCICTVEYLNVEYCMCTVEYLKPSTAFVPLSWME